ncbi:MAG: hypothetical protein E6997_10485 [Citrobacter sp.]|nr:hypothetical protein [Citrobacter sp.]
MTKFTIEDLRDIAYCGSYDDLERELALQLLASMEQEPVAYMHHSGQVVTREECCDDEIFAICCKVETPLYAAPQLPQPAVVVPGIKPDWMDNEFNAGWNSCRSAMLQGADVSLTHEGNNHHEDNLGMVEPVTTAYKLPDDFICMLTGRAKYLREKGEIKSPELLERAAAAIQGESVNTPSIPNGWKLVPIDPTKDMLRAGQSVVGFWLNTVHCYSKMLAAAPAAPQQEVKSALEHGMQRYAGAMQKLSEGDK